MRVRTRRGLVAALVVILATLTTLGTWAVSSPPGSSPDDDYHMASIWCGAGPVEGFCETTGDAEARLLPEDVLRAASCFAFAPNQAASCPLDESTMAPSTRGNWNGSAYPPVYYAVMHVFAGEDLGVSVLVMRLVNLVFYVAVMATLFLLLPPRGRRALLWGAAITFVPLSAFLLSSVNPSSWALISASGLWLAAWGFLEQRGGRKIALGAMTVLLMIVGAGARSDSAAYGVLSLIVAAVLAFRKDRRYLIDLLLPVGLTVVAVAFFFSAGQSAVVGGSTVTQNDTHTFSELLFINIKALPELIFGFVGTWAWGLGWLDTYMPGLVWVTAMIVFAGVVFWGLARGDARKWLALAGTAAGIVAVPLYILMHDGVVVGNGVQPRYVLPLIIVFAGVSVWGYARGNLDLNRLQLSVIAAGLAVANSIALHVNLRRYVTGLDRTGVNLDRDIEWWWNAPISPMGIWAIGSVAFAIGAAVLVRAVWPAPADLASTGDDVGARPQAAAGP